MHLSVQIEPEIASPNQSKPKSKPLVSKAQILALILARLWRVAKLVLYIAENILRLLFIKPELKRHE